MDEPTEWRPVLEAYLYDVNNLGEVRHIYGRGRKPTPIQNERGQAIVRLDRIDKRYRDPQPHLLERIVAQAFIEDVDLPTTRHVIHLDGDPMNCRADNLIWSEE